MPRSAVNDFHRTAALEILSREQSEVVSRQQLRLLGFDRDAVAHRIKVGRWVSIGTRVVALHAGQLNERQQCWAAFLHSGRRSALMGLSAARAEGLEGFEAHVVHTLVPHGSRATDLEHPLVRVRVTQSRLPCDVHPTRQPPRERLSSAVITAASGATSDQRARLLVISAVQQRRVRPSELRLALARRVKISRRSLLTEAIDDADGGVHSLPEGEWLRLCRRHDLPAARRQRAVQRPGGTWYLDSEFDDYLVSVEINGAQHEALVLAESDNHRRNVLSIGGRLVITLSSHAVRHQQDTCVAVVAAALMSRGWSPPAGVLHALRGVADRAGIDLHSSQRGTPR